MPLRSSAALLALASLLVAAAPAAGLAGLGAPAAGENTVGLPAGAAGAHVSHPAAQQETATPAGPGTDRPTPASQPLPPPVVTWRAQVQADGDARWEITVAFAVRDANDTRAFENLADSFEESESPLALDSFRTYATEASAATGREMELRNVETDHTIENDTGTLSLAFTWSNFAEVNGNRVAVGDAFNTSEGTWLPSIPSNHRLVIAPPDGYGVSDSPQVGFVNGAAWWEGPYTFDGREPWVVYSGDAPTPTTATPPNGSVPPPTSPGTATTTVNGTATPGGPFSSALPVALIVLVAGVSAAVLALYIRTDDDGVGAIGGGDDGSAGDDGTSAGRTAAADGDDAVSGDGATAAGGGATAVGAADAGGSGTADDGPSGGPAAGAEAGAADAEAGSSAGASAGGAAGAGAAADAADGATDDGDEDIDEALLSDEERVERLLERNGGRMKQASIVKETGWSNAKVSQLLSAMAEDDRVDKLRIGRENLISFPDEDVTDIDPE